MASTLISIIGTGMFKTDIEPYLKTEYIFKNGKSFTTRLFLQSLLECKYREINQIVLVGTRTSSWDALVDKDMDDRDETIELWDRLFDQCETMDKKIPIKGISDENILDLQKYLTERFGIPVSVKVHTQNIDDESVLELFECYTSICAEVSKENDILFDITHGFRSMPILLYQSLQYAVSRNGNRKVELVYGELDLNNRSKGYVRNLNKYWELAELSDALNLFKSKLDGFKLAKLIEDVWPKGSKAIKAMSEIVQTNFSIQIVEVFKQIRNALKEYPSDAPQWLEDVKKVLEDIVRIDDQKSTAKTLLKCSRILYEKKLNVQAVITLQTAVESAIVEKYGNDSIEYGDYEWIQDMGKEKLNNLKKSNNFGPGLKNLEHFRNQIAHGGAKNRNGQYPHAANIPSIYQSGLKAAEDLFNFLGL